MSLKLTAVSLLLASVALAAEPTPATVVKEGVGEAAIVDGNRDKAFSEAKAAALREVVEQVAGVLVSSDTLTANSQMVSDRIFSHSTGYVRTHEVLERKEEGGVARVKVRAEVGTAELDKDLRAVQALVRRLSNRRLLIVLQEQAVGPDKVITRSAVLTQVLGDAFLKDGWRLIDPAFAAGKLEVRSGVSLETPAPEVIQGMKEAADYIITGRATFRHAERTAAGGSSSYFPVTGEWDMRVFATDSGTQLAHLTRSFDSGPENKGPGLPVVSYERTSFEIAQHHGRKIVADVRKAVVESLAREEQNGTTVVMQVQGLADFKAVKAFKEVLARTIRGVSEVKQGNFEKGQIQFDLRFLGSTEELADALGEQAFQKGIADAFGGGKSSSAKASVTGVTSNTVELTLAR